MTNEIISKEKNEYTAYRGNKNLKRSNITINYTEEQIKEYIKCSNDPIYFIENYVKVVHIDQGLIPMILRPYQKKMVETVENNRKIVGSWPRQSGKSSVIAAHALHMILFNENYNVLIAANKGSTAKEIMKKVQTSYEYLPKWLQQGIAPGGFNKSTIELENGSRCITASTSSDSARGFSFNCVILDEFAFLPRTVADDFFTSIYPTISSGSSSKMIVISTPNGLNHFYKMYTDALNKVNEFVPIAIHWNEVPGRDEKFKAEQIKSFGLQRWRQEFESEFLGSSNTLISAQTLQNLVFKEPIETILEIKVFEKPIEGRKYFIPMDPSEGKNQDYHAFLVIDITERPFKVVASWRNNTMDPLLVPDIIYHAAKMYNDAGVLIETKSSGNQIADELYYTKEYWNVLGAKNAGRNGQVLTNYTKQSKGLATSVTTKSVGCSNLRLIAENEQIHMNDFNLIEEISNFSLNGNTYRASDGFNDDLVMCLVIFAWATTQKYFQNLSEVNISEILAERQKMIQETFLPIYTSNNVEVDADDEDWAGWERVDIPYI